MIYRRPQDFETAKRFLLALRTADVKGVQADLRETVLVLDGMGWFDCALGPLYNANAVVKLVTNSLVPTIQELVLEKDVLNGALDKLKDTSWEKYTREYADLRQQLLDASALAKKRAVSDEFGKMRDAMEQYAQHEQVQRTLSRIYCALPTARLALRLMTQRIGDSLKKDCEILVSEDIPLEAFNLS